MDPTTSRWRVALIAAEGLLPIEIASCLRSQGLYHHVFGIRGLVNPENYAPSPFTLLPLGRVNPVVRAIEADNLTHICLAGGIVRPRIADLRLDWNGWLIVRRIILQRDGDDTLLRRLMGAIEAVLHKPILSPSALVPHWHVSRTGCLTRKKPDASQKQDIIWARSILDALAPFDIGQAIVVDSLRVLAIETAHGTQAMLDNLAQHVDAKAKPRGVLIKAHKPGQSRTIDLPSIGPDTLTQATQAGLAGIAIEAKHSFILDIDMVVAEADRRGLFVTVIPSFSD